MAAQDPEQEPKLPLPGEGHAPTPTPPTVMPAEVGRVDLTKAKQPTHFLFPKVSGDPKTLIGRELAIYFFWLFSIYVLFALASIVWEQSFGLCKLNLLITSTINSTISSDTTDQLKRTAEAYNESVSALLEFHKTIIVNVIFPILTALLGYIFAHRQNDKNSE